MIKPPVIVLAYANYYGQTGHLRRLIPEKTGTRRVLDRPVRAEICEVVVLDNATLEDIVGVFQDDRYKDRIAIFHFSGHANSYALGLETPFREKNQVYAKGFAEFLGARTGLQLVFLNGCSTALQAEALIQEGIPAVITTRKDVDDHVAEALAINFYGALAGSFTIDQAFCQAKGLLDSKGESSDTRALYQPDRVEEDGLPWKISYHPDKESIAGWNLPEAAAQPLFGLPQAPPMPFPLTPYPGLIPYPKHYFPVFWGRDTEIRELYQLLTDEEAPAVILAYGAPGVGKTSLLQAGLLPYLQVNHLTEYISWADCQKSGFQQLIENIGPEKNQILLIDELNGAHPIEILEAIYNSNPSQRGFRFLVSIRTASLEDWQKVLVEKGIAFQRFYLKPPNPEEIGQIVRGGPKQIISRYYRAEIEEDFEKRIAITLSNDKSAFIAPVLQYLLCRLWKKALSANLDRPVLNWQLFLESDKTALWADFIEQQLAGIHEEAHRSGLLLNILKDHLPVRNPVGSTSLVDMLTRYEGYGEKTKALLDGLITARLLSNAAIPQWNAAQSTRLSHQILEVPLLDLLNQSSRPGQEIPRILQHHLKSGTLLNKYQVKLIREHKTALPLFSEKESALMLNSITWLDAQKKKIQSALIFRFILLISLLVLGYLFFSNPFLLLYFLLLYVAHHFSKSIRENIEDFF
ncbi:MAG: CHAT domain-containing protein [Saprospiraceae bacterium]